MPISNGSSVSVAPRNPGDPSVVEPMPGVPGGGVTLAEVLLNGNEAAGTDIVGGLGEDLLLRGGEDAGAGALITLENGDGSGGTATMEGCGYGGDSGAFVRAYGANGSAGAVEVRTKGSTGAAGEALVSDGAGMVEWGTIGGGWPPPFPAAPTLVESVAFNWNVGAGSSVLTLASVPTTGDVLILVQTHNQYDPQPPSGGGATWRLVDFGIDSDGGSIMPISMWIGVVGGTPAAAVTANWEGGNSGGCSLASFRGLTGVVEATAAVTGYQNASLKTLRPLLPILSPLCVAVAFSRSTSAIGAAGSGFTAMRTISGSNPGAGSFVYKLTTQLENVAPSWASAPSASWGIISALIF